MLPYLVLKSMMIYLPFAFFHYILIFKTYYKTASILLNEFSYFNSIDLLFVIVL